MLSKLNYNIAETKLRIARTNRFNCGTNCFNM